MTPQIGDYVVTIPYGYKGRVYDVHASCPQDAEWVAEQAVPLTAAELAEPWLSVLVHGGGSIAVPASRASVVEPFEFHNDSAIAAILADSP